MNSRKFGAVAVGEYLPPDGGCCFTIAFRSEASDRSVAIPRPLGCGAGAPNGEGHSPDSINSAWGGSHRGGNAQGEKRRRFIFFDFPILMRCAAAQETSKNKNTKAKTQKTGETNRMILSVLGPWPFLNIYPLPLVL